MIYSLLSYTIGFMFDKFVQAQANVMFMGGRAKPCLVGLGILSDFQFMMRLSGYELISSEEAPTISTHTNTPLKQGPQKWTQKNLNIPMNLKLAEAKANRH